MPTLAEWLPLGTAFVLGFLHALEVDHMVAVTAFVATRPALAVAARFGFRWGVGHSLAVLVAGGILLATGLRWNPAHDAWGEGLVGVMLIGVGLWAIRATRRLHLHPADAHGGHSHVHSHPLPAVRHDHPHPLVPAGVPHDHRHGITMVGLIHGLAGTTSVVALVPVALVHRTAVGVGYLLAFGLGTILAMTAFAMAAATAMQTAAGRSLALGRRLSTGVGMLGVLVGIWWIARAVGG